MIFGNTITDPKVAFSFEGDQLTLYAGLTPVSLVGKESITGAAINTPYKYYFRLPSIDCQSMIGNIHVNTIYCVEGFEGDQRYSQMIFSFPALDYFLANVLFEKNQPSLITEDKEYNWKYECNFRGQALSFLFTTQRESIGSTNYKYTWRGMLRISCEQSFDTDFAYQVARYVQELFSFIYNRADIALGNVVLLGHEKDSNKNIESEMNEMSKVKVEVHKPTVRSTLCFSELFTNAAPDFCKYNPEKHVGLTNLESKFGKLICMLFDDKILFSQLTQAEKKVYDLKHILCINFDFEYYYTLLDKYFCNSEKVVTKCSEQEKSIQISKLTLSNKLIYIFNPNYLLGRDQRNGIQIVNIDEVRWNGISGILSCYYDESLCNKLIDCYVEWRNAEAHAKDYNVLSKNPQELIESLRFVECMNYSVVLRMAGYSDDEARSIIDRLLFDQRHVRHLPSLQ